MKRLSLITILIIILLSACGPAPAPTPIADALFVEPGTSLGPISPYLYGTNYGPMHAVTLDRMPQVENAGFTTLRFPGGAWTDTADMKNFQIDQLMAFSKQVGAMPTISVRLLGGKPETAAELVHALVLAVTWGRLQWGNQVAQSDWLVLPACLSLKYFPERILANDLPLSELKQVNSPHLNVLP
jgi:hypothetical protein